jgi:hypothetical protein
MRKIKSITLITFFLCAGIGKAQTLGYVAGGELGKHAGGSLTSFNASTGALVNSFVQSFGSATAFAVGNDDSTLYIPALARGTGGELRVVSGQTGQLLNSVALAVNALKAILSIDGSTVYVTASGGQAQLVAIDAATLATKETISFGLQTYLSDIALSPDGTTLYASVICLNICGTRPPGGCTVATGICIFNASTLAFESQLAQVAGNLAVSQDGSSLYVTAASGRENLYIVNTSSLAVSSLQVSAHYPI